MIARVLLGRNSLQEVVGMLWGPAESNLEDKMTSGLQSPMDDYFSTARTRLMAVPARFPTLRLHKL